MDRTNNYHNHTHEHRDLPFQVCLLQTLVGKWEKSASLASLLPQNLNSLKADLCPLIPYNHHKQPQLGHNRKEF